MTQTDGVHGNTPIVKEQGGAKEDFQSGAELDVQSGGEIEIDTGGALEINNVNVTNAVAALVNPVSDNQHFIGLENILAESAGTWTMTRLAQGDYALVKTAAANTAILGIDITDAIRTGASKGLELASIDVIHQIGTANLTSNTLSLQTVNYANGIAEAVTNVPIGSSGACSVTSAANPYVDNLAINTPAYQNLACSKYVAELTVVAPSSTVFKFFGLNLHFTKSPQ